MEKITYCSNPCPCGECTVVHPPKCGHPCDCSGMEFICNRWVYTGSCIHRYTERREAPSGMGNGVHDNRPAR